MRHFSKWHAVCVRRSLDQERVMSNPPSDALVFFGATGDLAFKKIFPALQAMIKREHLTVPVIGVAKSGCLALAVTDIDERRAVRA